MWTPDERIQSYGVTIGVFGAAPLVLRFGFVGLLVGVVSGCDPPSGVGEADVVPMSQERQGAKGCDPPSGGRGVGGAGLGTFVRLTDGSDSRRL